MVKTGLDQVRVKLPAGLKGRKIGILCHAPSISADYSHITDIFFERKDCKMAALFGPQHGIYGQTQDNMIEWKSDIHPIYKIPLYSLYGEHRKPTSGMLKDIEALVIDLQDVGARLYTYIWTVKLCIEACTEAGIPVWVLDRPNPVGRLPYDGPVLKKEYFTFVGGASIPLCHRMTIGEMSIWIKEKYFKNCDLNVIWMKNWRRNSLFDETGLPWILPSPNIPTLKTALVYPGTVLFEALNISEGRGTTIPFELFGAPYIDPEKLKKNLDERKVPGCVFRIHSFIPVFNKYSGLLCNGLQIHIKDPSVYYPVMAAYEIVDAIMETTPAGSLKFNQPPYEYEYRLMPFDILSGDHLMRNSLNERINIKTERQRWQVEIDEFIKEFHQLSVYKE
jgi:uncharacterized protein YbbC (DUF1343 family)